MLGCGGHKRFLLTCGEGQPIICFWLPPKPIIWCTRTGYFIWCRSGYFSSDVGVDIFILGSRYPYLMHDQIFYLIQWWIIFIWCRGGYFYIQELLSISDVGSDIFHCKQGRLFSSSPADTHIWCFFHWMHGWIFSYHSSNYPFLAPTQTNYLMKHKCFSSDMGRVRGVYSDIKSEYFHIAPIC